MRRRHRAGTRQQWRYGYVDRGVPMLTKMFEKRLQGYRAIGYAREESPLGFAPPRFEESTNEYEVSDGPAPRKDQ